MLPVPAKVHQPRVTLEGSLGCVQESSSALEDLNGDGNVCYWVHWCNITEPAAWCTS